MNSGIQIFVQEFVLLNRFAIYIPLFLPIGLPILGSLFKAIKWIKTKRKQKPKTEWFIIFLIYIHAWHFFIQILLFSYTCVTFVNVVNKFDFYLLENVHAYIWFIHVFLLYHVIHIDTEQKKIHHLVNITKYSQTSLSRARQDCLKISSIWEFEISRVKYF